MLPPWPRWARHPPPHADTPAAELLRVLAVLGVDVPVEAAGSGGMDITLQRPKRAVGFSSLR